MAENPFADLIDEDPFADLQEAPLPQGSNVSPPPNSFMGRTEKYFKTGVNQVKEGVGGFVKEIFNPPPPQRTSEFDPDIDVLQRPVRQARNIGEAIGGGVRAGLSYPAGAISQAVVPPVQALEQMLGDKTGTVSKPLEDLMPDILALFGGAAVSRMRAGRSRDLLGENPPPPGRPTPEGFELPRNAGMTPEIPLTPRTVGPEVDLVARYASDMAAQAKAAGLVDDLKILDDLDPTVQKGYLEDRLLAPEEGAAGPFQAPKTPYGTPPRQLSEADAGAERWFPKAGGPMPRDIMAEPGAYPKGAMQAARLRAEGGQAVRSQAKGILDFDEFKRAQAEKERYDRLFATEDPNSRITRTPSSQPSIDEGSVVNVPKSDYTIWPERTSGGAQPGDITQMHSGVTPKEGDLGRIARFRAMLAQVKADRVERVAQGIPDPVPRPGPQARPVDPIARYTDGTPIPPEILTPPGAKPDPYASKRLRTGDVRLRQTPLANQPEFPKVPEDWRGPGAGPELQSHYNDLDKLTNMHAGLPIDTKKIAEYIKSLPGVTRLIDATSTPRAYVIGPSKSPEYLTATREVKGGYALTSQEVDKLALGLDKEVSKAIKNDTWAHGYTKDEARMRVDLAYGGDTKAIPKDSNLGQAIAKAGEIRDQLTAMQAERGIISEAAAARPGYAKQVYARDLVGGNEWAKRISPEARAKGIEHILNTEQIKVGNQWRGVTRDEAAAIAESIITEGHTGRFAPRIKSPYSANTGSTKARQNIPVPIKNLMGVVDDGVYRIARSIHDSTNLVISHDFLKSFSQGSELVRGVKTDWVSQTPRMGYTRVQMNDFSRRAMGKNPKEDLYILDKYADDFAGTYGVNSNVDNFTIWDNLFNPLNNMFKASKTIYNPSTHGRNILGNVIFSSGAGNSLTNPMNIRYYAQALKESWSQGALYKEAVANGTLSPGFATQELKLMADKYHANKGNFWGFFKDLSIESLGRAAGNALPAMSKAYVNNPIGRAAGKAYNMEDQVFKLASYIKQRELGMSAKDASLHVNKFFPRYDELSPLMQGLAQGKGQVIGSPFASFAAESLRIGKNMAATNPILFAAWAFGVPALTAAAQAALGLSNVEMAREYNRIPPEMRNKFGTWILPTRDANGNVQFIDTTYWHPLGQFYKGVMDPGISNQISNMPFVQDFIGGNPIFTMATEIMRNTQLSPYRRGELVKRPSQGNEAYLEHFMKTMAPPLAPFGTGARQIMAAATNKPGRFGQKKSLTSALIGEVTPFRVTSIDPAISRFTRGLQKSETRRVDEDLRWLTDEFKKGKIKASEYRDRVMNIRESIKAIQEKFYEK